MNVSVCIATFRRPERLKLLLDDLRQQQRAPTQVVIVDNDVGASAYGVVQRYRASSPPFTLDYAIEAERNIASARNRSVALARGDWIAFIDDDERAPEQWLTQLLAAAWEHSADGVLGPVEPEVPDGAPAWIRKGSF
ncbi:MAG TPA: glycosyltransferase, partial [Polyangiales bacterium]|nr:glycosyltransferase [Polyangiales bacterium]